MQDELEPPMQQRSHQTNEETQTDTAVRRSGRIRKTPSRYKDFVMGKQGTTQTHNLQIDAEVINPPSSLDSFALKSVTDLDTLYL
jgi:hypothetical protein